MLSIRSVGLFVSISVFAAAVAQAQDDPLSARLGIAGGLHVDDVVRAVIESSHDRRARLAEIEAARAEIDRALFALVPRLELSASYTRLSEINAPSLGYVVVPADQSQGGPVTPTTPLVSVPLSFPVLLDHTQLRAQLVVPVSDYFLRVLPSRDAAEHGVRATEALLEATEHRLALEAVTLYWTWVRARLAGVVAAQALERAAAHRDDARRLRDAGVGIEADVARAEAQVAEVQALLDATHHLEEAVADRLRTIMHVSTLPETIGEELPSEVEEAHLQASIDTAWERRSELRALDAQIAALEAQRIVTDAAWVPRLDVIAEVLAANPNQRYVPQTERFDATWAVGARVSWQLADAVAANPARRVLEARIEAARETRELAREGIRAEIVDAHRALADARSSMAARLAQAEAAERTLRQATDVFRAGRATGLPVIDAQTLLLRARLDLLGARIDLAIADARMRRARED